jgi:hypothetical protein
VTWEAFEDFELGAVTLSRLEIEALRSGADALGTGATKGEETEFKEKMARLVYAGPSGESMV